ncbi:ABC transporter permease [Salibaculum sp.]|uniref:ABC transporter permease n=1 Tax=Salibaculum sp. TaxID=2855480 RepID=UPI002B4A6FB3|nr:ABC transporter permease [Salibaculum sp.]HKL68263.1 ABC transporter permease [Salibaculum sp.]
MSTLTVNVERPPLLTFTMPVVAVLGACFGFVTGNIFGEAWLGFASGAVIGAILAGILARIVQVRLWQKIWGTCALFAIVGLVAGGLGGLVGGAVMGLSMGWFGTWIGSGQYRAGVPIYYTAGQTLWHNIFLFICAFVFFFLIAPLIPVMWLSFNAENFFTFTPEMLAFQAEGYSLKHYREFFSGGGHPVQGILYGVVIGAVLGGLVQLLPNAQRGLTKILVYGVVGALIGVVVGKMWGVSGAEWMTPLKNSLIIAPFATLISVSLGTLAAIGLSQTHVPGRQAIMAILISPMIVPLIISATGMFFFYAPLGNWLQANLGLNQTFVGYVKVILAHAALGVPFVIITVTATLVGFDKSLTRAAANMGANPVTTFFRVQMPLILPGVISGGLFAFITSFDEVVVVLFVGSAQQQTLPWQMFTGLREQISPTILAAATILVTISICLLTTVELLRRRSERLRGMSPG